MAIKKRPLSPRQRMINLLYLVLMAMLALNVSNEVLDGFSVVGESLDRTTANAAKENQSLMSDFVAQFKKNPEKAEQWYRSAEEVKHLADSMDAQLSRLKTLIVQKADGKDGKVDDIVHKEDLEAASAVMLGPGSSRGKNLQEGINRYREMVLRHIDDPRKRAIIASNLSTEVPQRARGMGKNWSEYMFESMPVAAAVTLLTKLQSDVRQAESEALHTLMANIDMKDVRVNSLSAYVIPEKTTLYPGERFSANIVMAAVDTTQQPEIVVNGQRLTTRNGRYTFPVGGVGEHSFSGYVAMRNAKGDVLRRPFVQRYEVIPQPSGATLAADLMNVLYAGYPNPMQVSVSGIPQNAVRVSMAGGTLTPKGNGRYVAVPSTVGKDAVFTVTATDKGKQRNLGTFAFRVRKLPDPTPYIALGTDRFKGGAMTKAALMGATSLKAAIDDGLLDIEFRVTGFEAVFYDNMGNAIPMAANGASFTENQRETFRKLSRNRRFYITRITAVGPDGIARRLPAAMEIIVK